MEIVKNIKRMKQRQRYPSSCKVVIKVSAPYGLHAFHQSQEEWMGNVQNVSEGGLCLITNRVLKESQIIKIKLSIPNEVVTFPTLAEVRWVKRQTVHRLHYHDPTADRNQDAVLQALSKQDEKEYLVGLRFLL